ncbi:STAS domain-containing protein [Nocardioides hankookensis]
MNAEQGSASEPQFSVTVDDRGDVSVVQMSGELDVYTAPVLREALSEQISGPATRVVVDLTGLSFMDSTGLGVLVGTRKAAVAARKSLAVVAVDGPIMRLIAITGLEHVLEVFATVDEAAKPD